MMVMSFFTLFVTSVVLFAGSTYQLDETVLDLFPDYKELHKTVRALQGTVGSLQASQRQTQSNVNKFQASLNQLTGRANRNWVKVGFYATRIKKQHYFSKGSTIPFERVWVDSGSSGYNRYTGVFKARLAGLYSFSATVMARYKGETVSCGLAVNNRVHSQTYGSTNYAQGVISAVLKLRVGDQVKIVMVENGGVYGHDWSSFSGFLIQQ